MEVAQQYVNNLMKNKPKTIGEAYGPAMEITEQSEADAYFEKLVAESMAEGKSRTESEAIQRSNLGYYAGYYSHETRERVERLFKCAHPVFGSIATKGPPTPQEAFKKGVEWGQSHK